MPHQLIVFYNRLINCLGIFWLAMMAVLLASCASGVNQSDTVSEKAQPVSGVSIFSHLKARGGSVGVASILPSDRFIFLEVNIGSDEFGNLDSSESVSQLLIGEMIAVLEEEGLQAKKVDYHDRLMNHMDERMDGVSFSFEFIGTKAESVDQDRTIGKGQSIGQFLEKNPNFSLYQIFDLFKGFGAFKDIPLATLEKNVLQEQGKSDGVDYILSIIPSEPIVICKRNYGYGNLINSGMATGFIEESGLFTGRKVHFFLSVGLRLFDVAEKKILYSPPTYHHLSKKTKEPKNLCESNEMWESLNEEELAQWIKTAEFKAAASTIVRSFFTDYLNNTTKPAALW